MRRLSSLLSSLMIRLAASSARAAERSFVSDGVRIRYLEQGQGEALLLVHGFSRTAELSWAEPGLFERLAADYRVLALDCRGHGKSSKPKAPGAYGLKMVEDLRRLLDSEKIAKAHLIGYSMGGRIALKFACAYPERVRRLALIASGGARKASDRGLWERTAESLERGEGIRPLIEFLWPDASEQVIRINNERTMAANDAQALAGVARQIHELATAEEEIRQACQMPMLAAVGAKDPFRPEAEALKKLKPAMEVVVLEGADHVDVLERPELRKALDAFLRERRQSGH